MTSTTTVIAASLSMYQASVPVFTRTFANLSTILDKALADATARGVDAMIVVGGDGTQSIAHGMSQKGIKVVGIPKTIDNDICVIDQSFGFQTAFAEAAHAIKSGYVEATAAPNGLSIIKLMGRYSGFIACYASLADTSADVVLIPEVPFDIEKVCKYVVPSA